MLRVKTNLIALVLLCVINVQLLKGQNFIEDFKKINMAYTSGNVSFNIKFDYYNNHQQKTPNYTNVGSVKIKGKMMRYKLDNVEVLYDTVYTCVLDYSNKTIMIDTVRLIANHIKNISLIDSLSKSYKKIEYKENDNLYAQYTIYSNLPSVSHSVVVYNKSTFLIQKISIYFSDEDEITKKEIIKNKIVITYSNIDTKSNFSVSIFKPFQYLNIKGRKVKLKEAYKNYNLINNMDY